ncbi:MAG: EamA family transporter [Cyanobium sp.]
MIWSQLALLTAFCQSGQDLLARRLLRRGHLSVRLLMGSGTLVAGLLALPAALLGGPRPEAAALLPALGATALVNGLAFWAYGRALRCGELSLVVPLTNLSPLVLLGTGWLLLGERPGPLALAGVLLLVAGALWLGRTDDDPRGLWGAPGAAWMLLVALLWGIGAGIDKIGVRAAGTADWVAGLNLSVALPLLLPALAVGEGSALAPVMDHPGASRRGAVLLLLLAFGVLGSVGMALQMEAVQRTAVVHVIAIKRLSTLLSAAAGGLWFGEARPWLRLPAVALMLAGAALVLLSADG